MAPNLDVHATEKPESMKMAVARASVAAKLQGNPLTGVLCRGMIEVMHKASLIVLMPLLILGGTINATEQAKPHPAAKPLSACALVTKAEIKEIIGTAIGDGVPRKDGTTDICAFKTPKGEQVNIFVTRSPAKRDLSKALDQAREAMPTATVREVPGLGDKALLVDLPIHGNLFSVYRAGDTLVVSVLEAGDRAKADAAAEKIARKAFKRF